MNENNFSKAGPSSPHLLGQLQRYTLPVVFAFLACFAAFPARAQNLSTFGRLNTLTNGEAIPTFAAGVTNHSIVFSNLVSQLATNLVPTNALFAVTAGSTTNLNAYYFSTSTNGNAGTVDIRQFGAYVDGVAYNGCYCSNTTTLYDPLGRFTAADVGLYCWMRFGGTNGLQDWVTTIASYTSPNVLVLTAKPAMPTYNLPVVIGHDDSSAWQTAFNQFSALGASVTFFVPVNPALGYGISMIATNFNDIGDWRSHFNSQLHVPLLSGLQVCPTWTIAGTAPQLGATVNTYTPQLNLYGSVILCCTPYGNQGTNWYCNFNFSAETGGSTGSAQAQHLYGFNDLALYFKNIQVMGCYNDDVHMLNCAGTVAANGDASIFTGGFNQFATSPGNVPLPTFTNTVEFDAAQGFAYPMSKLQRCQFNYGYVGINAGDNTTFDNVCLFGDPVAIDLMNSDGGLIHLSGDNTFTGNNYIFATPATGIYLVASGLDIQELAPTTNFCLVNDPYNSIYGSIEFANTASPFLTTNQASIIGGKYIDVHEESLGTWNIPYINAGTGGRDYVGQTANGGFPQAAMPKNYSLETWNYSQGCANVAGVLLGLNEVSANINIETMGGGGWDTGAYYGPNYIQFWTAPNDTTPSVQRAEIDNNGNLIWDATTATLEGFENGIFGGSITSSNFTATPSGLAFQVNAQGNSGVINTFTTEASQAVWEEKMDSLTWPNMTVGQESAAYVWDAYSPAINLMGFAACTTNGQSLATGGFGSTATNTLSFGSTGITNTLPVNIQVYGVAGSSIWITNATTGFKAFINQSTAWGTTVVLQPGDAITGSSLQSAGVRAF